MIDVVRWNMILFVLVGAFLPVTYRVARALLVTDEARMADVSAAFALPVGLLLITYVSWLGMVVHLPLHRPLWLWVLVGMVAAGTWWRWGQDTLALLRTEGRRMLGVAGLYLLAGGVWWVLRAAGNAHFIPIGEHVMNLSFAQMFPRYQQIPPPNPFFAGQVIDFYYYFFALIISTLAQMTFLPLHEAYFLMGVTWPALVAVHIYVLVRALSRRRVTPWLAVGFYMFLGNWGIFLQFAAEAGWIPHAVLRHLSLHYSLVIHHRISIPPRSDLWWFFPTRLIPDATPSRYAITEFPLFSFLIGDLHPHVVVLPWTLLGVLVIAVGRLDTWARVAMVAFLLGFIAVVNSWTFPVLILLLTLFTFQKAGLRATLLRVPAVTLLALLFFLPFHARLHTPIVAYRLGLFPTPLFPWALHWGPFLLPLVLVLGTMAGAWRDRKATWGPRLWWGLLLLGGIGGLVGCVLHVCLLPLLFLLLVWVARAAVVEPEESPAYLFLVAWILLNMLVDVFYAEDFWGGRYNTIFKVYFEAWTLLAVSLSLLLERLPRRAKGWAVGWAATGLIYTLSVGALLVGDVGMAARPVHTHWLPKPADQDPRAVISAQLARRKEVRHVLEMGLLYPPTIVKDGFIEVAQRDPKMLLWYPDRLRDVGHNPVDRNRFFLEENARTRAAILRRYDVDAVILGRKEHWVYGVDVDFSLAPLLTPVLGAEKTIAYRVYTPTLCFDDPTPIVFRGSTGEVVLERLRITRGKDFSGRDVLALFEVWTIPSGDPAAMSLFAHFLNAEGKMVGQGDHALGVWGTRWQDLQTGRIAGVHWTRIPAGAEVSMARIGVWMPAAKEYFRADRMPSGLRAVDGGKAIELPLHACR